MKEVQLLMCKDLYKTTETVIISRFQLNLRSLGQLIFNLVSKFIKCNVHRTFLRKTIICTQQTNLKV